MNRGCKSVVLVTAIVLVCAARAEALADEPRVVQFSLSDGNHMAGYVYATQRHRPFVILVHGASDSHTVFDFAPGYRTAVELEQRGFGVMTVDRVGYGASSRPDGDTLTFAAHAGYLHEVVQAIRHGALGTVPDDIVLVGPSVGADVIMVEAGTYHDVDGVAVCFNTDQLQPALFAVDVGAWLAQGPYFDFGVDFRTDFFYAEPYASPQIIELDNATRSLVPRAEIVSALHAESAPFRSQIDVPVLLLQGDSDELFVPQDDSALFTSAADIDFVLLRHSGHKGFSHATSKQQAVRTIDRWLRDHF